mmetsp:Transcript_10991/g.19892  ORF Transcript_10991/g.19892 Transcript_10991/m.19892 type:complete len:245 (+) Transcript_10991:40-774(+)
MTPREYVEAFKAREAAQPGSVQNLCGRFIRGREAKDFLVLSEEPRKKLSWVCSSGLLNELLGMPPTDALLHIGFRLDWLRERLRDGTEHKLVVFYASGALPASWDNIMSLIWEVYDAEVYKRLEPHLAAFKTMAYEEIDPEGFYDKLTLLPMDERIAHPDYLSDVRFLALPEPVSLLQARGFLYCQIGCNCKFLGTGFSPSGQLELLVKNAAIEDLPSAAMIDLTVTAADLDAHSSTESRQASS